MQADNDYYALTPSKHALAAVSLYPNEGPSYTAVGNVKISLRNSSNLFRTR